MLFYFVRHGDPCYVPDSLTPLGQRQAEALGRRIARCSLDRIYASPLKRAIQTAQPAAEMLRKEIEIVDFANESKAWQEMTFVDEEGVRRWACVDPGLQKLFATKEMRELGMKWYTHPIFKDTTIPQGMERIARESDAFFRNLGYERMEVEGVYRAVRPNNERVGLFAHAGFGGIFLSHVLGIPYPQLGAMLNIAHSSLTVLEFSPEAGEAMPLIHTAANDAHLYHENLPVYDRPVF